MRSFNESTIENVENQETEDMFYGTGAQKFKDKVERMFGNNQERDE